MYERLAGTPEFVKVRDRMSHVMRTLSLYHDEFMKANLYAKGNRMESLTCLFRGGSGIGKTRLMPVLTYDLVSRVIEEDRL